MPIRAVSGPHWHFVRQMEVFLTNLKPIERNVIRVKKILATVKVPMDAVDDIMQQLSSFGVENAAARAVPYAQFVEESRMNYDCVFQRMWEEKSPVAYIEFSFDGNDEGRAAAFHVEYNLMQIPLNLRYDMA